MYKKQSHISFTGYPIFYYLLLISLFSAGCASQKKTTSKKEYHRIDEADSQTKKIIKSARSFRGTPYRWGGTTRAGMDCSGLLVVSFQSEGITLPRTSNEQSKVGRNVSLYDLKPGDLVFFAAKKNSPHRITHVGMVTEIRGKHDVQFIHASTKLGVVENNIHSDYYRRIFVKARRLF